jgi:hypothetical protein
MLEKSHTLLPLGLPKTSCIEIENQKDIPARQKDVNFANLSYTGPEAEGTAPLGRYLDADKFNGRHRARLRSNSA